MTLHAPSLPIRPALAPLPALPPHLRGTRAGLFNLLRVPDSLLQAPPPPTTSPAPEPRPEAPPRGKALSDVFLGDIFQFRSPAVRT